MMYVVWGKSEEYLRMISNKLQFYEGLNRKYQVVMNDKIVNTFLHVNEWYFDIERKKSGPFLILTDWFVTFCLYI